ncbi:hypothetical protein PMZ80_006588 [Knufia obscura]|uniref:Uncharacterized protein n=2 Tax=Knufia TaxID=430999 RepID=A0AAN8IK94_9EURO|nr:hypothetical protein PMZ80_006588 [Knufia obscura]KAK5950947.1 hypothetical protein OHC33_008019 [Knufia fluminis]
MTTGSQPTLRRTTDGAYAHPESSDLLRLPFFRSQVLKQENDAASSKKQGSKAKPSVVKTESSPEVKVSSLPRSSSAGSEDRATSGGSDLSQAAHFPSLRKRPLDLAGEHPIQLPQQPVRIYVQSEKQPHAIEATLPYVMSGKVVARLPKVVVPASPGLVQSTLSSMKPMVVYSQYECDDGCRSRGTCVHFSFLLGCRQVPDGLICPTCQVAQVERPYAAQRICPRHNKRTLSQFTPNLPEDYLPTIAQQQRAFEIFERSWNGDSEGVPTKVSKRVHDGAVGRIQDVGSIENADCPTDGDDSVLPSIKTDDLDSEHARKKRKTSADNGAKIRKYSSDKENNIDGKPESAENGNRLDRDSQADDVERTPRPSALVNDYAEAGATVDSNFWSPSLPPWSPEPNLDLFS